MKSDLFTKLAFCWNLQSLDVSGCTNIQDQAFGNLAKGEVQLTKGQPALQPGLIRLHTVKLAQLTITDFAISSLVKVAPNIEHLELTGCASLTDYSLKTLQTELNSLKFLDLSGVTAVNLAFFEDLKVKLPQVYLRRYQINDVDKKDNGLRVPRRVIEKKKAKKGGKKKKK